MYGCAFSHAAVDSEKLAVEGICGMELVMDPGGQCRKIRVHGACDDAVMIRLVTMETDEFLTVAGVVSWLVAA